MSIIQKVAAVRRSPTVATWASIIIRGLNAAVVLPIVLVRFSPAESAVWFLFASILGLHNVLDLGFKPTFVRFISYLHSDSPDRDRLSSLGFPDASKAPLADLRTTLVVTMRRVFIALTVGGGLLLAIGGTFALARPIGQLGNASIGWIAWLCTLPALFGRFWGDRYIAYLEGTRRIAQVRYWSAIFAGVGVLSNTIVVLAGGGLIALAVVNQLWQVAIVVWNRRLVRRSADDWHEYSGDERTAEHHKERQTKLFREIWSRTWKSAIGIGFSYGLIQATGLAYAQFGEMAGIASYLFSLRLFDLIKQISQAPFYTRIPAFGQMFAEGNVAGLSRSARERFLWSLGLYAALFLAVGLLGDVILTLIGSKTPMVSPQVWTLLGAAFFFERYGAMHLQIFSITNRILWHVSNGVTGLIIIAAIVVLVPLLGVMGFPLGLLAGYGTFYVSYNAYHGHKVLTERFFPFTLRTTLVPLTVVAVYPLVSILFLSR